MIALNETISLLLYREALSEALGFEPRYAETKTRCLTTWRRLKGKANKNSIMALKAL